MITITDDTPTTREQLAEDLHQATVRMSPDSTAWLLGRLVYLFATEGAVTASEYLTAAEWARVTR